MCRGKGSLKKISDNSECSNSVIPRSLLRGASLTVDTYGKWLPMESQAVVDRLDGTIPESDSKPGGGVS
jgi:hypothetical protein